MADIKDKLERLKKEREARSRSKSQLVKDAWEEIEKTEDLSVKDKLERLISLTRQEKPSESKIPPFEPLKREPLQFFENPYPLDVRYGKVTISSGLEIKGNILTCLSKDSAFENLDLSTALFIDLETTGISGGTGVIAFLVGLGFYRDDKFYVAQFFLGELAEEERMIQELGQFFSQMNFQSVVTFNGKGFDMPLLETRFILHKQPFILSELPHLDFLYSARSLWRHKHESCRLYHLAREVVEADRSEDIPAAEIPWRYFQYINTGNFELIEPILYHNQEDILSLLGVVVIGSFIFSEDEGEELTDAMDLYGAGRVMENIGEAEKSVHFFKRALEEGLSDELSLTAKKKISCYFKKNKEWKSAVSLWKEMTSANTQSKDQLLSFRELAMYLEHREKKYEEARKIAEEGYVLSLNFSSYYEKDFAHRRERLKRKIQKQKEKKK
ncbi:MAG: hypothetical protein GTN73_01825 [Candidatus Aminicenantes bacterium]|nr:hypothetical protein [Candidatus Aminicenantes bacterium]